MRLKRSGSFSSCNSNVICTVCHTQVIGRKRDLLLIVRWCISLSHYEKCPQMRRRVSGNYTLHISFYSVCVCVLANPDLFIRLRWNFIRLPNLSSTSMMRLREHEARRRWGRGTSDTEGTYYISYIPKMNYIFSSVIIHFCVLSR